MHGTPRAPARFTSVAAPWGPVHLAVSDGAVVAVEVLTPTEPFVRALEHRLRRPVEPGRRVEPGRPGRDALLDAAAEAVEAYLAGAQRSFDLPIRLEGRGAWDRAILSAVAETPWGTVTSYGRVARRAGRPGAARAAGGAIGRNPIGLLVPCHRVIAGDGTLGGYGGDWFGRRDDLLAIKRDLLALEGIRLPAPFPDAPGRAQPRGTGRIG